MEQFQRRQETKAFREQAVKVAHEQKLTIPKATRRPPMSEKTIEN